MSNFLTTSDFLGLYDLAQDKYSTENLEWWINDTQECILIELFGKYGSDLFVNDFDFILEEFSNVDYAELFEPFTIDYNDCCKSEKVVSKGIKDMLLGFTYDAYLINLREINSINGTTVEGYENAEAIDSNALYFNRLRRYNRAVNTFNAIACKIMSDREKYADFKPYGLKEIMKIF